MLTVTVSVSRLSLPSVFSTVVPISCPVQDDSGTPIYSAYSNTVRQFGKQIGLRASSGTAFRWVDTGGSLTFKRRSFFLSLLSADEVQLRLRRPKHHRVFACELEVGAIPPRPVAHHADTPGQGNGRALLAPELRQTLRPGPRPIRPLAIQRHRNGLIERRAQTAVAGLGDPADDIPLAALLSCRCQSHPRADVLRTSEPLRILDRECEGQGHDRVDAGH